jgi:hypothetical protein
MLGLAGLAWTALVASAPAEDNEVRLRLCAPAWRNIGKQRPQDVAQRFTVIFGHLAPGPFHEGSPQTKCLKYTLGPYTAKWALERLPSEVFAKDSAGSVIKARSWQNWIVVPDNPKWLEHIAAETRRLMDSDFDGLFVDSMGTAPVEGSYLLAKAINPNTGKLYGKADWLAAELKMMKAIKEAMPRGKLLTLNGLGPGTRYWTEPVEESPRVLLDDVDGAMSESIWRASGAKLEDWPTPERWMLDARMIQDVDRHGRMGFWWTKCWTDGNTSDTQPNAARLVPQWRRFALGSYLLAAGPKSYFNFDTRKDDMNAAESFPEYDVPLGHAVGSMQQVGSTGVYARQFSGGMVLVNPTPRPVAVSSLPWAQNLPAAKLKSWGEERTVQFPLEIEAHSGLLLTPAPQEK